MLNWCCLQEFEPWFKWMLFDAILFALVSTSAKQIKFLRPAFEAVGWI